MTTIQIVAACMAGALYLLVLIVLRSVSRVGVHAVPRKPHHEPRQLTDEGAADEKPAEIEDKA